MAVNLSSLRKCFRCHNTKPLDEKHFGKSKSPDDFNRGFTWQCKYCLVERGDVDFGHPSIGGKPRIEKLPLDKLA